MRTKLLIAAASLTGAVLLNGCSTPLSAPMLIFPDVTGKTSGRDIPAGDHVRWTDLT